MQQPAVERPVIVAVPVDASVRRAAKPAEYTALPRTLEPPGERMGDGRHIAYAVKTECRLPDGARDPAGTLRKRPRAAGSSRSTRSGSGGRSALC